MPETDDVPGPADAPDLHRMSPRPQYSGRLELTWTNKPLRLLAHEDGSYEWVPASDYRVAEVRLLHDAGTVGKVHDEPERASDNLLIRGDALNALHSLNALPEFSAEYVRKVKLAYLDPPFNTGQAFSDYDDALEHSVWLTMMRDRLSLIKKLLSADGSIWVHLDDAEVAYARVLLDEVFGRDCFVTSVIWEKSDSPRNSARQFSTDQDYILVYSRAPDWRPYRLPRTADADAIYENPDDDPRGVWFPGDPFANKPYSKGLYEVVGPTGRTFKPPPGRYWRISEENFWKFDGEGRIYWGPNESARPSIKRYLSEVRDLVPRTLWRKEDVGSNRRSKNEMRKLFKGTASFDTPKPEALMERIMRVATHEGDLVLDCFLGSGTTAAVAQKMGRRWVGVERSRTNIETYAFPRLEKVVRGDDAGGVTKSITRKPVYELPKGVSAEDAAQFTSLLKKFANSALSDGLADDSDEPGEDDDGLAEDGEDVEVDGTDDEADLLPFDKTVDSSPGIVAFLAALRGAARTRKESTTLWEGGGGFRVLDVAPSMFEDDEGVVVIAEWAANTKLGEATAAQFGYTYAPDPPFCGRKGRFRLAVIDGNLSADVVTLLAGALGSKERLLVCGTSLDLDASQALRELSPGSEARKIPASIIAEYELSHRWRATAPPPGTSNGIADNEGVVKPGSAVDKAPEAKPV